MLKDVIISALAAGITGGIVAIVTRATQEGYDRLLRGRTPATPSTADAATPAADAAPTPAPTPRRSPRTLILCGITILAAVVTYTLLTQSGGGSGAPSGTESLPSGSPSQNTPVPSGSSEAPDTSPQKTEPPEKTEPEDDETFGEPEEPPSVTEISSTATGLCLTAFESSPDGPGATITDCDGDENERTFEIILYGGTPYSGPLYMLKDSWGQCLHLYTSDWKIHRNSCGMDTRWTLTWAGSDGTWDEWTLEKVAYGQNYKGGRCLQATGDGEWLDGVTCGDTEKQRWRTPR